MHIYICIYDRMFDKFSYANKRKRIIVDSNREYSLRIPSGIPVENTHRMNDCQQYTSNVYLSLL